MARPRFHALVTAPVAWAAARRWGVPGAIAAIAGGLLIDADHLVDYGWTQLTGERTHYYAPLHGWELSLLVAAFAAWGLRQTAGAGALPDTLVSRESALARRLGSDRLRVLSAVAAGLASGSLVHLIHDVFSNRPKHLGTYSLMYRAWHGFERHGVGWGDHPDFQGWSGKPWYLWF